LTPILIITVIILALITATVYVIGQVLMRGSPDKDEDKQIFSCGDDELYSIEELARFEPMREPSRRPRHYKPGGKEHK
jgi:NADH:ubiquinone oxidoreductase subunit 3 (subunit A)